MNTWKPMDTAPKDGTEILVWDGYKYLIVSWANVKIFEQPLQIVDGWTVNIVSDSLCKPIYWTELPEPPLSV